MSRARARRARRSKAVWRSPANPPPTLRRWPSGWRERCRRGTRLLYLAGRDRKPTLEAALAAAGFTVQAVEALRRRSARGVERRPKPRPVAACDGALHYSRRTAALAVGLAARAGLAEHFRALLHVCLSADVAEPLAAAGAARIVVAAAPDEAHLLAALERACGASPKG